jgi:hypothetical protein
MKKEDRIALGESIWHWILFWALIAPVEPLPIIAMRVRCEKHATSRINVR